MENLSWQRPGSEEEERDARATGAGTGEVAHADDMRVAGPQEDDTHGEFREDSPEETPGETTEPGLGFEDEAPVDQAPAQGTPAEEPSAEERLEQFMDPAAATSFRDRWRDVQSSFVDDPKLAVEQADELASEVLNALSEMLTERKSTLDGEWRTSDEIPDTEKLRLALRGYRDFFDRMLSI